MISLRLLLLVILTLSCREWAEGDPLVDPVWAGLAAAGISLGFGLLFKVSALRVLASGGAGGDGSLNAAATSPTAGAAEIARRGELARQWIEAAWLVSLPLALLSTGWGPALNSLEAAGLPQVVAMLGWFLPSVVLIMLIELTAAQLDELCQMHTRPERHYSQHTSLQYGASALQSECDAADRTAWPREWLLRMRLGQMASLVTCLTPLLLIAALTDVAQNYGLEEHASRIVLAVTVLAIGCIILFLPLWLGKWMGVCEFPDGELRRRIERQLSELQLHGIGLRLLRSEGRWPGAAIVGWFPRFRQMWLGDALMERLTPQQLDMVIMHELAHVTSWHYLWRVFPMVWAGGVAVLFGAFWPASEELRLAGLLIGGGAACVVMLVGMSLMAHQCELEADLAACKLAEQVCHWTRPEATQFLSPAAGMGEAAPMGTGVPDTGCSVGQKLARRELAAALTCLLGDSPQAAAVSWLHPSLQQRLLNLRCRS